MSRPPLPPGQRRVYDLIVAGVVRGEPVTVREIMAALDLKSPNGVAIHVDALIRKGYVVRRDRKSRGLRPVDSPVDRLVAEAVKAAALLRRLGHQPDDLMAALHPFQKGR